MPSRQKHTIPPRSWGVSLELGSGYLGGGVSGEKPFPCFLCMIQRLLLPPSWREIRLQLQLLLKTKLEAG